MGTPPSGQLNTRGVAEYSDFGPNHKNINWRSDCGGGGGNKDVCHERKHPRAATDASTKHRDISSCRIDVNGQRTDGWMYGWTDESWNCSNCQQIWNLQTT